MDFDTFDTDVWAEINDMPGEIYDIEEEKFDVQEYINGNTDYWTWVILTQIQYFHSLHKLTWTSKSSNNVNN